MDQSVQKIVGIKKSPKFIYKKLRLVGFPEVKAKDKYFESISEEKFDSVIDKKLLEIESFKLQKHKICCDLAGIEIMTKNDKISKHHGQSLDSSGISTTSLKDFKLSEVKVVKT